jgi:hypothetical protein
MEQAPEAFEPALCAEFPCDNPELHQGATWVCLTPTAASRPVVRPRARERTVEPTPSPPRFSKGPVLAPPRPARSPGPEELRPRPGTGAAPSPPVPSPPPAPSHENAFDAFVAALVEVALARGNTRAAAIIPTLLTEGRVDRIDGATPVSDALVAAGLVEPSGGGLRATESLLGTLQAWRRVLRGESDDLAACGDATLDEFAAALLAGFGVSAGPDGLRREVRHRGIAAFGVLTAA